MKKQTKLGLVLAAAAVISVSVASLVSARGWVQNGADWYYVDNNNEYVTDTIQASGNSKFYLGEDGAMMRDYFLEDYNGATYYFGSNGAMVTNTWVAIDSSIVDAQADYIPDAYWYYFGGNGKAIKGKAGNLLAKTLDGKKYVFNENGQMCTGWVKTDGGTVNPDDETNPFIEATYYCGGDNDGVVRTGWVSYYDGYDAADDDDFRGDLTTLYFYFNPNNGKKTASNAEDQIATKNINGKTYAFNDEGIMLSGWDAWENYNTSWNKPRYLSGEDDGHLVKKGWVYAVPGALIDSKAHDEDEEKYMYFSSNGDMYRNVVKKINGKYYIFNGKGIMQTGLIVRAEGSEGPYFYKKVDLDESTGEYATKRGIFKYDNNGTPEEFTMSWDGAIEGGDKAKLHLFGSDGARRVGANQIEFSDNTYTFVSKNSGNYISGITKKKYYSLGFLCSADPDIKYGLFVINNDPVNGPQPLSQVDGDFNETCNNVVTGAGTGYMGFDVLGTSGSKVKGAKTAKKDADSNYWLIDDKTSFLVGIYTVPVKKASGISIKVTSYFDQAKGTYTTMNATDIEALNVFDTNYTDRGTFGDNEVVKESYTGSAEMDQFADYFTVTKAVFASVSTNKKDAGYKYTTLTLTGDGYFYQSDYNGSSNKWIPVGIKDQSGSTAHVFDYAPIKDDLSISNQTYSVVPDNAYFLNCYFRDVQ